MAIQDREIEYDAVMGRVVTGPSCTSSKDTFIANAMGALAGDTRNADRLNNAAVALFWLSMGDRYGVRAAALGRFRRGEGSSVFDAARANAYFLLNQIETTFAPNRAALLNLAFFTSVDPSSQPGGSLYQAIDPVTQARARDPRDPLARLLLSSLQSRLKGDTATPAEADSTVRQAHATLLPLIEDRATEPLGQAALGDAYLTAAATVQQAAPYLARAYAADALGAYDDALAATTDPGVYAGRAAALDLLGDQQEAIGAQRRAVVAVQRSLEMRLGLATLLEEGGDVAGMRVSARQALAVSLHGWNPPLPRVRLIADAETGLGYLGVSYGSDRDPAHVDAQDPSDITGLGSFGYTSPTMTTRTIGKKTVTILCFVAGPQATPGPPSAPSTGGGGPGPSGGIVTIFDDIIPRTNHPEIDQQRRTFFGPDEAEIVTLSASAALGDVNGARADAARWQRRVRANPALAADPLFAANPTAQEERPVSVTTMLAAAYVTAGRALPAGANPPAALDDAQTALRRAGDFKAAAALCRRAAAAPARAGFNRLAALTCEAESSYLAGPGERTARAATADATEASAVFERLYRATSAASGASASSFLLDAAVATQVAGSTAHARELYARGLRRKGSIANSLDRLGDLNMDGGDYAHAVTTYDEALAHLNTGVTSLDYS